MEDQEVVAYQERRPVRFNPNEHIIQIPNKGGKTDYLPVQWRLVWFRELCPQGTIETEMIHLDLDRETEEETYAWNQETRRSEKVIKRAQGIAVFKAIVTDGKGGKAEAYKSEKAASFGDFIEKANTGAVGRALAMLGYGTQFAEAELSEEDRIVDAPVERKHQYTERKPFVEGTVAIAPGTEHLVNGNGSPAFPAMPQAPTLADITDLFGKIYKPERFPSFKQMVLERTVADKDLTEDDRVRLWDKLSSIKRAAKGNEQPAA